MASRTNRSVTPASRRPPTSFEFPFAAQSAAYLSQAIDALTDACSAAALYVPLPKFYKRSLVFGPAQEKMTAQNRRLQFLRNTALFAALAAEAYANEFITEILPAADEEAVDRLSTPDKLLLAPRIAGKDPPLNRGADPFQSLAKLFKTRNALVHPRPGGIAAAIQNVTDDDQEWVGPKAVVEGLNGVARTIVLLEPLLNRIHLIGEATLIAAHRTVLEKHIAALGDDIWTIPAKYDPTPVHLLEQMRVRAEKKASSP